MRGERPSLSFEEESRLCRAAQAGNRVALETVAAAFEGLVVKLALRYARPPMLCVEDGIQEGRLGVLAAVRVFDPARERRLSTLVYRCVMNRLGRALLEQVPAVRLPANVVRGVRALSEAEDRLEDRLGRPATDEEVRVEAGFASVDVVARLRGRARVTQSLDAPLTQTASGDESDSLVEYLESDAPKPEEAVLDQEKQQHLVKALLRLNDEDQDAIRRRFGLPPYQAPQTLGEIARALRVTPQTVHRIVGRALHRLRLIFEVADYRSSGKGGRGWAEFRRSEIVYLASVGMSRVEIAKQVQVTLGCVSQVLSQVRRSDFAS